MVCQHLALIFWLGPDFVNAGQRLSTQAWRLIWLTHSRLWLVNAVNLKMCTFYISRNVFFKRTFIDKKVMKVSCFICSSAPLWILFCKVAAGIVKHQIRSTKSSSIKLSVFSTPWFVLLTACVLKSKKYPFGQAENLQTKGKNNQNVWHRWTIQSESSWKSRRHGSANIFPNASETWVKRK